MRRYDHDTYYYGGEIVNTINKELGIKYAMDRGGKYIWVYDDETVLYLDLFDNDNAGQIEWHSCGSYQNGMTALTIKDGDCEFDEQRIISFIKEYF